MPAVFKFPNYSPMCRIIAVANVKGGVGKTTVTLNLSAALAECKRKVLVVDFDPQASLTLAFGLHPDRMPATIGHVLDASTGSVSSAIVATKENLDLVPSNYDLRVIERALESGRTRMLALRAALESVRARYDYILIDCPANAGVLTGTALAAADQVIIPMTPDYLSYQAVHLLLRILRELQAHTNPSLRVLGLLLNMYDPRIRHGRTIVAAATDKFGSEVPVFATAIRQSVRLKESPLAGQSILRYAPRSDIANLFRELAAEIDNGTHASDANEFYAELARGRQALAAQDWAQAYAAFCRATELKPEQSEAWMGRAESAEEWDEKIRCTVQALHTSSEQEPVRAHLDGLLAEILPQCSKEDVVELLTLGYYLEETSEPAYAHRFFRRASEVDLRNQEAWLGRARTASDPKEAVQLAEHCLELDPSSEKTQAQLDAARQQLKQAAANIVEQGFARLQAGDKLFAYSIFKSALDLDPQNDRAWLGCAYTTVDWRNAFDYARRALDINPENEDARKLYHMTWTPEAERTVKPAPHSRLVWFGVVVSLLGLLAISTVYLLIHI